ncbi:MAG: hypothetical protein FWH33_05400 [Oscillospiraceae bacterium]|nr:hypothetical protein [Oscillospiraceae bacterium]
MSQFDEFIYTIPKEHHEWGDHIASPRAYFRGNQSMKGSRHIMGFDVILNEAVDGYPHFHHSVEEYHWFTGSDLTKFFDFDAEIEIWLGDDPDNLEKYTITEPTLIRCPPNFWHGPINYKRVGKPVAFSAIYFDGEWSSISRRVKPDGSVDYPYLGSSQKRCVYDNSASCTHCGKCFREYRENPGSIENMEIDFALKWRDELVNGRSIPASGAYDKYIFKYPVEYHQWGDRFANPRGKFRGETQLPGVKFFGGFSVVINSNNMEVPHLHHANDEYLWFTGSDLQNFFDYDSEIEIYLGWDPDNMEKIVITEPTVIRVPPDMWHCPINFKRIDKPVGFLPIYPDGDWSKVLRKEDENGRYEYVYQAATLKKCVYDKKKTCWYCGKCSSDKSIKKN